MTQLVFVVLGGLNNIGAEILLVVDGNLDFATNAPSLWMSSHEVDKLLNGVVIRACANVKKQAVFGLQVFTDALEEPLVGIDLSIISMLDAEHKVDSAAFKEVFSETKVPRRDLEAMKHVGRDLVLMNTFVHYVSHIAHLEFLIAVQLHKALLKQNFLIEETFFTSQRLHAGWNVIVTIGDHGNQKIILREISVLGVGFQTIIVVKATLDGSL